MNPVVYVITNSANGRKYVGCTGAPIKYRIQKHMSDLKGGRHTNKGLQEDFDKYGADAFTYEVVDQKRHVRKENEERLWMIKLKTYDERYGYNNVDPFANPLRKAAGLPCLTSKLKGRKRRKR